MQEQIRKLAKCLKDHRRAFDEFSRADQAMRSALDEAVGGLRLSGSASPVVTGHVGAITKAATTHDAVSDVFRKGQELFHDSLRKAVDGMAQHLGVTLERVNPNLQAPGGDTAPTEESTGSTFVAVATGKAMSAFELKKALDHAQSCMPRFGKRTSPGTRANPNSLGNPLWTGRQ